MTPARSVSSAAPRSEDGAAGAEPSRRPRADWIRNRARIVEAAEEVFGTQGLAVPIDRIAERAEVGVGTLYRHFPTKEALFQAIVMRHFEGLVEEAREAESAADPAQALFDLLRKMVRTAVGKRDLAEALNGAGIDVKVAAGDLKDVLDASLSRLLARGQAAGTLRADVSPQDLMSLVAGACITQTITGGRTGSPERMLEVVLAGLSTRPPAAD
jgi:AcrR family transcriptional regulator